MSLSIHAIPDIPVHHAQTKTIFMLHFYIINSVSIVVKMMKKTRKSLVLTFIRKYLNV